MASGLNGQAAACPGMDGLIVRGAYGVVDRTDRLIGGCNLDQPLVPASVVKIATAAAALEILGSAYRFATECYLDRRNNLYIRGQGDPTLVSEAVTTLARQLRAKGIQQIDQLYIDTSFFALEHQVPGGSNSDNPYDAPVGPVSVNFNSVALVKEASGRVRSGESQTPTLPIMTELGAGLAPGSYRLNICFQGAEATGQIARHAGELLCALLRREGIAVQGLGGIRPAPTDAHLVHTHFASQPLVEIIRSMLHYSTNFTANQVYLACGVRRFGPPATWAKGRTAVQGVLARQLGRESADTLFQIEGAGLSRDNRVTARSMLRLLAAFRPHADLLPVKQGVRVKTGTLTGVYNLAGYGPDGEAFVILLNQKANHRERVLEQLKSRFAPARRP